MPVGYVVIMSLFAAITISAVLSGVLSYRSARLMQQFRYRAGGGLRTGVLADFFIGAHAVVERLPLLTRDARRYQSYFPTIELITP